MGKREKNQIGKDTISRRHPIRQQLMAVFLGICMMIVSIPVSPSGLWVQAAENSREILSFLDLPDEVKEQTVGQGFIKQEPEFPTVLEAQCRSNKAGDATGQPETAEAAGEPGASESGITSLERESAPAFSAEGIVGNDAAAECTQVAAEPGAQVAAEEPGTAEPAEEPGTAEPVQEPGTAEPAQEPGTAEPEETPGSQEEGQSVVETVAIEGITWNSEIEYDGLTEGVYVFMPTLPEGYVLAEGVELPKITVTVENHKGLAEGTPEESGRRGLSRYQSKLFVERADEGIATQQEPGCGTISEDTVWSGSVTLANGELIVEPGVTLTIQGVITVEGNVTVKGGGTIKRGSAGAYIKAYDGAHLTVGDVTIDGAGIDASSSMLAVVRADLILDDGCIIKNCVKKGSDPILEWSYPDGTKVTGGLGGGGALFIQYGTAIFNDIVMENNSSGSHGGAVGARTAELRIYGGVYRNNRTTGTSSIYGGGCLYNVCSKFYIYGGRFIGNSSRARGGCIYNLEATGAETYLYGGIFERNTSSSSGYVGNETVYHSAYDPRRPNQTALGAVLDLSGNVEFCGNGNNESGGEGIYLDINPKNGLSRKVRISDTLRYPVTLYLKASEGYVIAEGTNEYRLLHERDMKKIHFVDVGNSGKTWYAVLDKEKNQVYLSQNKPDYGYYVYYLNNGAQGAVVDDNSYQIGNTATVQPSDGLQREGYAFKEWNTEADGSGEGYQPGEELVIEGDTDLYAIFAKGKVLKADFYSGSAGQKQTKSVELAEGTESGNVTAPELEEMEGWRALGWSEDAEGYDGLIEPGEEISLSEDKEFYGVYEKDVTLSYQAENADSAPEDAVAKRYANVHEEISTTLAQFTVAPAAVRYGYAFAGWNVQEDLEGRTYKPGDAFETEEDAILYAIFKRPLHAYYHSGSAGQAEEQVVEIPEDATSGTARTQELKPFGVAGSAQSRQDAGRNAQSGQDTAGEGWQPVGWDLQKDGYDGEIGAGTEVTLTDDTDFYGVYRKEVTLSYDANGGEACPPAETKECRANVHEEVSYENPRFTVAAAVERPGYVFTGWDTERYGSGVVAPPFAAGEDYELEEDTTLYAQWEIETASYRVEHYLQDLEGDGYTRVDADTESIAARAGAEVEAEANVYAGFTENEEHALRCASGIVEADGSLVLKLYYDRDIYEIDFDLNGGEGAVPNPQKVRYGGLLQEPQQPLRRGYTFKGWHRDAEGLEGSGWEFGKTVEGNTDSRKTTLYAKWADEVAPVLGEASFGTEYRNLMDWVISRKKLVITVPITEEGSGLKQGDYRLVPEKGEAKEGAAVIRAGVSAAPEVRARSGGISAVMTLRGDARDGQGVAEITIAEDFKGSVFLTCTDYAGNVSVQKMLTADGAGAVVEDNAPDISFTRIRKDKAKGKAKVSVNVTDTADESVTAGIASVSYQVDGGKAKVSGKESFAGEMVEKYGFDVALKGEGEHTLKVTAQDNAGNRSVREAMIEITKKKAVIIQKKPTPPEPKPMPPKPVGEPKTGEHGFVKIFATLGMIAGFTYLLLYFCAGESGVTENEKEEIISRLVQWAQGAKWRKYPALLVISIFLVYYHSIGKSVDDGWKKAYEG